MIAAPVLTPHGVLILAQPGEPLTLAPEQEARLQKAFARGCGHGLLALGIDEMGTALPPVLSYWRELGARYVTGAVRSSPFRRGRRREALPGARARGRRAREDRPRAQSRP